MTSKLLCAAFVLAALPLSITFSLQPDQQKVLLVSFDGFRWDYLYRVPTPHFHHVMKHGVRVKQVTNIFITKTYPNHYTLVTGLFAENHGVVANDMFDPMLNKSFSLDNMNIYDSEFWEEATPIWITNQRAGHASGAAMWPGTDVKIHESFPAHYMPYNASVSFEERVAKIIEWFTSKEPINLGLLYWEDPDDMGHHLGPDSPLMGPVISDIDNKLGYLMQMLKKANLWDTLNLIITSDHGMTQCSEERVIELDQYLDRDLYLLIDGSPVAAILPKEGKFDEVYEALAHAHPNLTVYKKEEIPERWHYKYNNRVQPIIAVADEGWYILQNKSEGLMLGNHGYDNALAEMHPIFLAHGPAFRKNFTKEAMSSTDLYPLLCHLLSIPAMPHNGSLRRVQDLLSSTTPRRMAHTQSPPPHRGHGKPGEREQESNAYFIGVTLGSIIVIVFFIIFFKHLILSQIPALPSMQGEIAQPLLQA
ncbi:ectonucleotide pyrophosphatase/phosphodiesterase family member 5 [Pipistrellus kuhlii]|uniref:Ectonucleotide pyrophosphatase/phosphodiesterase family member 5 n=1 Tax=Pipistrellus kuhlii TaxID=59472 RepID=A0A7J7YM99_PIPKU|nr:ectonucleotide pyrophosphatase/phosphodiesterase family member 5 [Pipistrellus kuhlii]XP_045428870.1 ectonucleotide pyrophosphatase/phosphodiesterase family member 5 [Pipistrellus kuhlii]XP_045428871.1 ectonucleotide pyrophosphatase/phosphodiesterase family member 5 [Pipistrellus kuhlii]KAF6362786.1 ectonucleotide pyrophosphatase/phosphodiesterase family member 5 [Pipistrellus kuhlii]